MISTVVPWFLKHWIVVLSHGSIMFRMFRIFSPGICMN